MTPPVVGLPFLSPITGGFAGSIVAAFSGCQRISVQDQKASGTVGGVLAAGAFYVRDLLVTTYNNIVGASLDAVNMQVTLPEGNYLLIGSVSGYKIAQNRCVIYNATTASVIARGLNACAGASFYLSRRSVVIGYLAVAGPTLVDLRHRGVTSSGAADRGSASTFGDVEVYADLTAIKLDSGSESDRFALFAYETANGVTGAALTSGAWRTTPLATTLATYGAAFATLAANQISLPAGTFCVVALADASYVDYYQARWYDVTNDAVVKVGTCHYLSTGITNQETSIVRTIWTAAGAATYELQQRCSLTGTLGRACNFSVGNETYDLVLVVML